RDRDPRDGCAGRRGSHGAGGDSFDLELRAGDAHGSRRGYDPEGRSGDRAADPLLLRATRRARGTQGLGRQTGRRYRGIVIQITTATITSMTTRTTNWMLPCSRSGVGIASTGPSSSPTLARTREERP